VTVKNTGTTVQVDFTPGSNTITWAGKQLALLQYHFHTPSEHTVEGAHSSMEAHLVHRDLDTGAGGGGRGKR
jgi:carbonic anhydrase